MPKPSIEQISTMTHAELEVLRVEQELARPYSRSLADEGYWGCSAMVAGAEARGWTALAEMWRRLQWRDGAAK